MTLTKIIVAILLVLLASVILIANRVRAKRRENEPIDIYDDGETINPKGTNLDVRSTYDDRLLKKYESLAIWIKLRERYGKRLISYRPKNDSDADRVNTLKDNVGMPIYVKYVAEDGRVLSDEMYVKFLHFHDMVLVTMEEHEKLKKKIDTDLTITPSEINAMKSRLGNISLYATDERAKELIYSEKRKAL